MTVGVFSLPGGTADAIQQHVTTTGSAVTVAGDAKSVIHVHLLVISALSGTPTLVIDVYDGSTAFILQASVTMGAATPFIIDRGIYLRPATFLRLTVSGSVDVTGIVSLPNAQGGG